MSTAVEPAREKALQDYRKKLLEHKEVESRLKERKSFLFLLEVNFPLNRGYGTKSDLSSRIVIRGLFTCSEGIPERADQTV